MKAPISALTSCLSSASIRKKWIASATVLTAAFTRTNTDLTNIGEAMKYAGTGIAGLEC